MRAPTRVQAESARPRSLGRKSLKAIILALPALCIGAFLNPGAGAISSPTPLAQLSGLVQNTCLVSLCINVDSSRLIEPAARQASGILHSMNGDSLDASHLSQLGVSMWRSSSNDWAGSAAPWTTAAADHVPITYLLSDKWLSDTGGGRITPWSDWNRYRTWVSSSVEALQGAGSHIDYWEVYNEPDYSLPPSEAVTATPDRLLTQFRVAYEAIRSVSPNARIIGPSTSGWIERPTSHSFSMAQFLDFAVASHLSLAAINWHYNAVNPSGIEQEVAQARALVAERPELGRPMIFINEYGTQGTQRIPGWDVQYLGALTDAQVNSAGRSCWQTDCSTAVMDGLLASDGVSTLPDYWVRAFYAQMTGNMVAASASSRSAGVIASVDPTGSEMKVLLGYGQGCTQDPRCAASTPWAVRGLPVETRVTVRVPWSSGHVEIAESRIPGSSSVSPIPQPAASGVGALPITLGSGGPTVTLDLGSVTDGDAWSLTLTHAP
jgi:hypothetical protein